MTTDKLNAELSALVDTKALGLGVIAFKGGREVYGFFGGRRHLAPDKPLTRKTLFRAASLSKMFTAFSIMQLVERGKLKLSDDAGDWLGFKLRNPHFPDEPITIEMLASHTSSLRDGTVYSLPTPFTLEDFFTAGGAAYEAGAHFATEAPGNFFSYCNLNYGVLGTIIERVTGKRFDLYQRAHVLEPLGLGGGYVVSEFDAETFANLGTLYQRQGDTWQATLDDYDVQPRINFVDIQNPYAPAAYGSCDVSDYVVGTNATIFSPPGGLRLSFDDLSKALAMMINRGRNFLSAASFDELIRPHWTFDATTGNGDTCGGIMENYGLGTYRIDGTGGARLCKDVALDLIGHSGEAFGQLAGLYIVSNTGDGVAFMTTGATLEAGEFGTGYLLEERIVNPVCQYISNKVANERAKIFVRQEFQSARGS